MLPGSGLPSNDVPLLNPSWLLYSLPFRLSGFYSYTNNLLLEPRECGSFWCKSWRKGGVRDLGGSSLRSTPYSRGPYDWRGWERLAIPTCVCVLSTEVDPLLVTPPLRLQQTMKKI